MNLTPFARLIKERCGIVITEDNESALRQGIEERMLEQGLECHHQYFSALQSEPTEVAHLINLLTVNETYFLREYPHFKLLTDRIIPELLNSKSNSTIRILSAGCATGEEPYSIAIALLEKYGHGIMNKIDIKGFDIDQGVIKKAKAGVYGNHSFRGVASGIKEKYFQEIENNRYVIKDFIKQAIELRTANLLDPLLDNGQGFDIIFYRNVSIYFDSDTQRKIFKRLSDTLNNEGFFFLSSTETMPHDLGILALNEIDNIYFYQKKHEIILNNKRKLKEKTAVFSPGKPGKSVTENHKEKKPAPPKIKLPRTQHVPEEKRNADRIDFDKALALAESKKYEEALELLENITEKEPSFPKGFSLKASVLINLKRLEEAKKACFDLLAIDEWNLEGHLLLGMIARMEEDEEESIRRYKGALYIQPSCWIAHFHLGDIFVVKGELNGARREYSVALNLLQKNGLEDSGLMCFALSFPVAELIHLCEHNLKKLDQRLN